MKFPDRKKPFFLPSAFLFCLVIWLGASEITQAAAPSYQWWNVNYQYRERITVTAGATAIPNGYSVSLTFNHASLVSGGKSQASGDDIRVVYWNGSAWVELNRALEPLSSWNNASTKIWFKLQAAISASGSDNNYYLYYSYPSAANPPKDWANVFTLGDDFNDGMLTAGMTTSTAGTASITETGGEAFIDLGTNENTDAGILVSTNSLAGDKKFIIRHKTNLVSGGGASNPETKAIGIYQLATRPTVMSSPGENNVRRITVYQRVDGMMYIFYLPSAGAGVSWNGTTWVAGWLGWTTLPTNTYYIYELISDGTNWYVRVSDANGNPIANGTTTSAPWASVWNTGDPLWFYWGEVYTNYYYADQRSDWFYLRNYVTPEPTTSLGSEENRPTAVNPLIGYSKDDWPRQLDYSFYSSGDWGAGATAYSHTEDITWQVAKTNPKNTQQAVVWVDSTAWLHASIWNGTSWNTTALGFSPVNSSCLNYRCFDAAYEQSSGQLFVVASDATAGVIRYWVWDGASWIINGTNGSTLDTYCSNSNINWIKMASKPVSDEIALILSDNDSVSVVEALIWDGKNNAWLGEGNNNCLSWSGYALSSKTTEAIAVEYEQYGNEALFVYGYDKHIAWATYNGSAISSVNVKNTSVEGFLRWLRLKADPNSDDIVLGFENDGAYNDIYALRWIGTGWQAFAEDPITNGNAWGNSNYHRPFDLIYESGPGHSGHIIFVYVDESWGLRYRHFDTGWSGQIDISSFYIPYWVQLERQSDNNIHLAIDHTQGINDFLVTYLWNNSTWTKKTEVTFDLNYYTDHHIETFSLTTDKACNFSYRKSITINSGQVSCGSLNNFPFLFNTTDPDLRTTTNGGYVTSPSGNDIIFRATDSATCGGTAPCTLDHEIEKYVPSTGELVAWVRVPSISNGTVLYIYFGNSCVIYSTQNPTGVWDSNYVGVYHLHENFVDSSGNSDATNYGSTDVGGKIAKARSFNGSSNYIDTNWGDGVGEDLGTFTFSCWVYADNLPDGLGDEGIIHKDSDGMMTWAYDTAFPAYEGAITVDTPTSNWPAAKFNIGAGDVGTWIYLVGTYVSGSLRAYKNGGLITENTTPTGNAVENAHTIKIGRHAFQTGANFFFPGDIDEVRISNIARNACWIDAEYKNQNAPSSFYAYAGSKEGPAPTAVKLTSFSATQYSDGVLVRWKTGHEVNNLGFHVYREESGQLIRLTPEPVAGSALMAGSRVALGAGHHYHWWDLSSPSAMSYQPSAIKYWLEDIDLNGKRIMHGPVTPVFSREPIPNKFRSEFLSEAGWRLQEKYQHYWKIREVREKLALKRLEVRGAPRGRGGLRTGNKVPSRIGPMGLEVRGFQRKLDASATAIQQYLAGKPAIKLIVRGEGWYRVTQPELVSAGLSAKANPKYLQLYTEGKEQPIRVISRKDGRFSSGDAIEFYGVGLDTPSTDTRVYWLIEGHRPGKRIHESKGYLGSLSSLSSSSYLHTIEKKDRTLYFAALRNGEEENFFGPVVYMNEVDQILEVKHLDPSTSEDALLEVVLQGATETPHRVRVLFNEAQVGEITFEGMGKGVLRVEIPQSILEEGENLVSLIALGDDMDASLVDTIRLTYWHTYTAEDNGLRFKAQGGEQLSIGGFGNWGIRVFDITDSNEVIEVTGKVESHKGTYAISFRVPEDGERTLLALTKERAKNPIEVVHNHPSRWHQGKDGYDLVIISHGDFKGSLQPLKKLRESQGFKVTFVDVEDIYDEFSFGNRSPKAIKDFLSLAKGNWKRSPRFVLLVGDASFDPRNYLGLGDFDFLPTKLIDTVYMETASDDWFVDFNNDGLPEMAIGRLPVQTKEEAAIIVSKIIGYEKSSKKNEALLVADKTDGSDDFNFEGASEEVRALLPAYLTVRKIFREQFSTDAQAKAMLLTSINQGALLVNFIGHGSAESWRGSLLTLEDADNLINGMKLPFFINMTCLNGYFQNPYGETLAEALMKASGGGAVAIWTSSGLTEPDKQAVMNKELIKLLFNGKFLTLGEATAKAKASVSDQDIRKTWILFGDPTQRLTR